MNALLVCDGASDPALREALAEAGASTVEVAAPDAAVARLMDHAAPELIVIDVADARRTCRRVALATRHAACSTAHVIVALADEGSLADVLDTGVDDCLARPVRPAELVARARRAQRTRGDAARRLRRERRLLDEIRSLQRQKHDLECIACVDTLTGIANRRHVLARLHAEWKRAARDGTGVAAVMVDLDAFHAFNERYGHIGGDHCLRSVTEVMATSLRRPSDVLGRYGGEEFIAVLGATDGAGARIVAERLRAAVEALAIPHDRSPCAQVVTVSVGFAACRPSSEQRPEALIAASDAALLAAKSAGRNRIAGDAPEALAPVPSPTGEPWRRFPTVVADPWFADRIPQFLAAKRAEIAAFRAACGGGSFDSVRALARRLRASALEHGFELVAQLAGAIERAARSQDRGAIEAALDELAQYVEHVQVRYRRPLERRPA